MHLSFPFLLLFRICIFLVAGHIGAKSANSASQMASIALQAAPSGTFYVNGSFAPSMEMPLLLDTGSSFTIINDESARNLKASGAMRYKRKIVGTMADGSEK